MKTEADVVFEPEAAHYEHAWTNAVDQNLLEDIAPNGEYEYILTKIDEMQEDEAIEIILEGLKEHQEDDWNFPATMRQRMKKLMEGPKLYGDNYDRDLRVDAVLLRHSSPYPEVRSVSEPIDDPDVPVETIRAYFLGLSWAVIGTFVSTFFNSRFPSISLGSSVIQILLYPCAKFLQFVLPDWGVTVFGTRHSLNPGPVSFKEVMFATITFNVAIYTTNTYTMILVQKKFYDDNFVNYGYELLLTIAVQFMGMGFAGLLRRFSVYPTRSIWPTCLPTVAMNRALLKSEIKDNRHGWTISRYKFFFICFASMFVYFWVPGYLFTALSTFNWMTWIAPQNHSLATIAGSITGLGFNPITTFDWNVATSSYAALSIPFFSVLHMFWGSVLGGLVIVGIYYTNQNWTAYLPINSSSAFTNTGGSFNVQEVVVDNKLVEDLYQQYSPPFYSAGYILTLGANFAFYPVFFLYIMGSQWRLIKKAYVDFYKGIRYGKGNFEGRKDVHSRLISRYGEVPDWWFIIILLLSVVLAIVFVEIYPVNTPVWLIFLLIGISLLFIVPQTVLTSTTGTDLSLGTLVQVITGYCLPNNPNAFMFGQALGSWAIVGYSDNYVQDQKMAYYAKIAPRAVFRCQMTSILITIFVAVSTENFIIEHTKNLCTPNQPEKFTCAGDGQPLFANSLFWGLLGSKRAFGGLYPFLRWCFLIGLGLAIFFIFIQWYCPIIGAKVRQRAMVKLHPDTFEKVDKWVFKPLSFILWINPVLIIQGVQHWAPSNMAYKFPGLYLSFTFMYYIKRRYMNWWEKYNYVLSASLGAGVAFAALLIYWATEYHPHPLNWWGNTVSSAGIDGQGVGRLPIPSRGYFGPEKGQFP
jgi:OPT family small oligopeptide transporter